MCGDVAQMVECSLSMREVWGLIPRISIFFSIFSTTLGLLELVSSSTEVLLDYSSHLSFAELEY